MGEADTCEQVCFILSWQGQAIPLNALSDQTFQFMIIVIVTAIVSFVPVKRCMGVVCVGEKGL